jgi:sugar lactone lactonase YvrE
VTAVDLTAAARPARRVDLRDVAAPADPVWWAVAGEVRAALGEHPLHDPLTGDLVWVDVDAGTVHGWGRRPLRTPTPVGLAWPTASGGLLLATAAGIAVLPATARRVGMGPEERDRSGPADPSIAAPDLGPLLRPADMPAGYRFNDGGTDPRGRLWIASMRSDGGAVRDGTLYRLDPADGADALARAHLTPALRGVHCGNGIAWSPDGSTMYLTDSVTRTVHRLPYDVDRGTVGAPEVLLALAEGPGAPMPDGTAVDVDGGLWVAVWGGGVVLHLAPEGEVLGTVPLPTPLITCPGFGAPGSGTLWVTTAGSPAPVLGPAPDADPLAGALLQVRVDVEGVPVVPVAGL